MDDNELVAALQRIVATGQYRDQMMGRSGDRTREGLDLPLDVPNGRRLFERDSAEHREVLSAGTADALPPLPRAGIAAIDRAEAMLGLALPPLLRRLYAEVGTGGFGPHEGLMGLPGAQPEGVQPLRRRGPDGAWPDHMIDIIDWGCGVSTLIDCSTADGEIWAFDPNPGASPLFDEGVTLRDFLELWITEGVVQPFVAESPDSGELQGVRPEARRRALPDLGPGGFAPAIWR